MTTAIPAPPYCAPCAAPGVKQDDCRYCQRYRRACGRHEPHPMHDLTSELEIQRT
jgi:hypothetical protein